MKILIPCLVAIAAFLIGTGYYIEDIVDPVADLIIYDEPAYMAETEAEYQVRVCEHIYKILAEGTMEPFILYVTSPDCFEGISARQAVEYQEAYDKWWGDEDGVVTVPDEISGGEQIIYAFQWKTL